MSANADSVEAASDGFVRLAGLVEHPRGGVLEQLRVTAELKRRTDALERELVARARAEGATWQQIGDALRVARQSAQRRFAR